MLLCLGMKKICTACKIEKLASEFSVRVLSSGNKGLRNKCKKCACEYAKAHPKKPQTKEQRAAHYIANREKILSGQRAKWDLDGETMKQRRRANFLARLLKSKGQAAVDRVLELRGMNKEQRKQRAKIKRAFQVKERNKRKRATDIVFMTRCRIRNRIRMAFKQRCFKKALRTCELLGCTVKEAMQFIEKQFKPGMTWENHGAFWHLDHKTPVRAFDISTAEGQKKCFHYTNLQPLSKTENFAKSDKMPDGTKARNLDVLIG